MRTLTQLVGTTSTTSNSTYGDSFTTLAGNNSSSAVAIGKSLINNEHRKLIQKYFDNEKTVTFSTIGGESLTLTGTLASNATSATLSSSWTRITCSQLVTFSNSNQRMVLFTNGSTGISWSVGLTATATTAITTLGVQDYDIPANVSKIKDNTVQIGQLQFHPTPVMTIQEWNVINTLPYTSDIPNYFFIYNGKLSLFPIPSTTGNVVKFNYKTRVIDMTYDDYSTGTLATMTAGSTSVTGTATVWTAYPQNVDLSAQNLYIRADVATGGDGLWYPILKFTSATALTLALPVVSAPSVTSATTYTIGQMPLLQEDFHPLLVQGALKTYCSTIAPNPDKFKEASANYQDGLDLLKDYAGTKQVNVDLEAEPQSVNPNIFLYASS